MWVGPRVQALGPVAGWLQTLFSAFSRKESSRARESDERKAPVSRACEEQVQVGSVPSWVAFNDSLSRSVPQLWLLTQNSDS